MGNEGVGMGMGREGVESGGEGLGDGERGAGDNINYLVKIISENKFFIFFRETGCFCVPLTFISLGNLSFSLS